MNKRPLADIPPSNLAHEVFSGAYDYEHRPTQERGLIGSFAMLVSRTEEQGEARAARWQASFANWRNNWRQKRLDKKEARKFDGSFAHIGFGEDAQSVESPITEPVAPAEIPLIPQQRQPVEAVTNPETTLRPHSVHRKDESGLHENGLYRSVYAKKTAEPQHAANTAPTLDPATLEIMQRAVNRARQELADNGVQTVTLPAVKPHPPSEQPDRHDSTHVTAA